MYDKTIIDQISKSYLLSKSILREDDLGITKRSRKTIDSYKLIVDRIDDIVKVLDENDKYIIYNEVVLGKKGEWYHGYISTPTYYRHRKIAYQNFLRCLNQ